MQLITPEISWHQKEPIFSLDFCPKLWKLATCGADFTIKIWQIKEKADGDNSIGIEFLSNLDRHAKPVNVVRFSPSGKILASGGDDGAVVLWKLNENRSNSPIDFSEDFGEDIINKENWNVFKLLRGHVEDVFDLAWSPDSNQLITGSIDNSAIIWDANKGQSLKILTDHKHYIQGVCWDPRGYYIATHSSDRSCRVYSVGNHKCLHNIHKNTSSYKKDEQLVKSKFTRMFMDETMQSFFRRCTFSPDGSFLFLPAGLCDGEKKPKKTSYIFARGHFVRPVRHLPGTKKATIAIRCSPICYELIDYKENNAEIQENNEHFKIPYRMIYAVVSLDAVTLYDTQHSMPIGYCANMHYASLTDATWSSDGRLLVISSTDGYCSFVKFDEGELGIPITFDPIEYQDTQLKIRAAQKKESKKKEMEQKKKEKDAKKAEEKAAAAVAATGCDTPVEKTDVDTECGVSCDSKEKTPKPPSKLDKNQPTIKKLFVTPVRKRKRPSESSPVIPHSVEGNQQQTPIIDLVKPPPKTPQNTPATPAHNVNMMSEYSGSLQTVAGKQVHKTPKRVNVTTLLTFNQKSDEKKTASPPMKPAKRVTVTTLTTFNDATNVQQGIFGSQGEILKSPVEIKSPLPEPSVPVSSDSSSPSNQPQTPKSRRKCNVVTPPRGSPGNSKPPKRVQVTTLSTFDTEAVTTSQTSKDTSGSSTETPLVD